MTDFEAEELLEGLEGEPREARLRLLEQLSKSGVPGEELRRAVAEDRLALLPVERALSGEALYTGRQVSEQAGVPLEHLTAMRKAVGLATPDPDELVFGETDLEQARLLARFRQAGLPEERLLEVARVMGRGLAQVAEAIRSMTGDAIVEAGATEHDLAIGTAQAARELLPLMAPVMQNTLRSHILDQVRNAVVSQEQLAAGATGAAQEVTVAFADLVDFTRLGETLPVEDAWRVAGELERLAVAAIDPPVRLVKTIGDEVMLVAPEPVPLLGSLLELLETSEQLGDEFPPLRIGVAAGPAVNRSGDWFGPPVNLASRITGAAYPGSVLATAEVQAQAVDEFRWSDAGRKQLKGIKRPVHVYRARRFEED